MMHADRCAAATGVSARARSGLRPLVIALAAGAALLLSCQTPAPVMTEQMSAPEYFQAAREAVSQRNFAAAMAFYEVYLERFPAADHPQEAERNLWAEYESAFLYHKLGDDETAIALLGELVAQYDAEGGDDLPPAPDRLAQRVIDELSPMDEEGAAEEAAAR